MRRTNCCSPSSSPRSLSSPSPPSPPGHPPLRSLFEKDKLLFAFLLCSRILESRGEVDPDEWLFLLTGGLGGGDTPRPNPAPEWLSDRGWRELLRLERLPAFAGLCGGSDGGVESEPGAWRPMYDSVEPHRVALPGRFGSLKPFHKVSAAECQGG